MRTKAILLGIGTMAMMAVTALVAVRWAQAGGIPGSVPIQGCLMDAKGAPVDGAQQVEFRLYGSSNAAQGDALYLETRNVTFRSCVFSEMLHPTDLSIFEKNSSLYLGMKIAGDAELSPRFEVGSTPYAVQARHADRAASADNGVPAGTIVAFGGITAPPGWLLCDGQVVDAATYPDLAAALGEGWGDGGDLSGPKFHLPDLRGRFLRGVDGSAGRDLDAASRTSDTQGNKGNKVGSLEDAAFAAHSHGVSDPGHSHTVPLWQDGCSGGAYHAHGQIHTCASWSETSSSAVTNISLQTVGGTETRPVNAAVTYIVKL